MRKRAILLFILGLVFNLLILPSIFAEEQITITTYYPSPYGSYNVLTVADRIAVGDINGDGTVDNNDLGNI
ncbi:MAG: hypothetical protein KJ880_05690, partial [Candidatus Omnitrophica bacterium]|nr:hypothetical protein [Candidatus Omnitrophota bacterium]